MYGSRYHQINLLMWGCYRHRKTDEIDGRLDPSDNFRIAVAQRIGY